MRILTQIWIVVLAAGACFAADAASEFKITQRYPVSGDGGFDYLLFDAGSNRLYVSHGTQVNVLDASSGNEVGEVKGLQGVHGVAVVPGLNLGFVTNGKSSTVAVFDTKSFEVKKNISVAEDPDYIFYDPGTKRVFVCNGDGKVVTAIDPEKQTLIGKVEAGDKVEAAVADDKGNGFVNLEEEAAVVHFDTHTLAVKNKWPITGCKTPTGLAIDVPNSRLFIACRSKVLAVMDSTNGKVLTTLPIGETTDATAFDADTKLIFASNGGGTVSVVRQKSANEYESAGEIQTQKSAKTMAYDPKSKRIFLAAAEMEAAAGGKMAPKPGTMKILVVEKQ
jgi:DNA-binding beta-propeller fold protein YncE